MNFGDSSHKTMEMRDCFWSSGAKMAPLSWNRANVTFELSTTVTTMATIQKLLGIKVENF